MLQFLIINNYMSAMMKINLFLIIMQIYLASIDRFLLLKSEQVFRRSQLLSNADTLFLKLFLNQSKLERFQINLQWCAVCDSLPVSGLLSPFANKLRLLAQAKYSNIDCKLKIVCSFKQLCYLFMLSFDKKIAVNQLHGCSA